MSTPAELLALYSAQNMLESFAKNNGFTKYFVTPQQFGAKGDLTQDDTKYIQAAIDSLSPGGFLFFPNGQYKVSGTGSYILKIKKPIKIWGYGFSTAIRCDSNVPNTRDIFSISPDMNYGGEFYSIQNLLIYSISGTPARHVFNIDVSTTGQYMNKFYMSDVYVQQHGGNAVYVYNAENKPDGFFSSTFERCTFYGGLNFIRSGDSIVLRDCTITGTNRGITVKSVAIPAQGNYASQFLADNCNITSAGGAVLIEAGKNVSIIGGNIEQTVAFTGSVIDISGSANEVTNITIERTHLTVFGNSGSGCNNLRFDNVNYAYVDKCVMANETGGINIKIDVNAKNVTIGKNKFESGTQISDLSSSYGVAGIWKAPTLLNNWVAFNSTYYSTPKFYKDKEGFVHLEGFLKDGTTTLGTVLFTLPVGFTPLLIKRFDVYSTTTGQVLGCIQVEPSGNVTIVNGGSNGLCLDGIVFSTV